MRARIASVLLLIFVLNSLPAHAQEKKIYFSITTNKTFRTGEKPAIQVYARNVDVLEFRVYKVHDPVKFFSQLQNVHNFGPEYSPRETVDERTWLEKFHDWKHDLWVSIRDFFRSQFSAKNRAEIRDRHAEKAKKSRITGNAGFANVPLLNSQQLVARWRIDVPSNFVSDSSSTPLDALPAGAYVVEATDGTYRAYTVLLVSDMALVIKAAEGQLVAYTADRGSGSPITDATVTTWRTKKIAAQFKTDTQGLGEAKVDSTTVERETPSDNGSEWVLAQHGDDVALVAPYQLNVSSDPYRDWSGYVYTDRPVYRPGDTVQFKAIIRRRQHDQLSLPTDREIKVTIQDAAQNTVLQKSYTVSSFGSVNGSLELPKTAALGYYNVSLSVGSVGGGFQVEEYKKPEYFVKVTPEAPRVLQGGKMKATIEARYYFGEPVANAKVKYVVHTQRSYYFGDEDSEFDEPPATEGGGDEGSADSDSGGGFFYGEQVLEEQGKLDANGRLTITIPTNVEEKYKNDVDYRVEARVTDAANREIPGHNGFLATYGAFHLSVEGQSYVYKQGETGQFTVKALDYDKKPVSTPVHVEMLKYKYGQEDQVIQKTDVTTGADGLAHFTLPLSDASEYTIRVKSPSAGRELQASTWLWVAGKNETTWAEGEARNLQFVADKTSYKVGDVAHVLVMGIPEKATLLLTTEGNNVLSKQLVHSDASSATVDIPITIDSQPNIYVGVVSIRDNQFYQGSKSLNVPPAERRLNIEITPVKQQFQPGEAAMYNVVAKDWQGKPVKAELSVGVVDDAVYAVEPDTAGDIVKAFYYQRYGAVQTNSSFDFYFHGEAGKKILELAKKPTPHSRALAQVKATDFVQPRVRKAFPDTAYWSATVQTDASGMATAKLSFPDSLTTWRTTVRAITADTRGGWAVNRVLVRKNLMVRLAVPRFFRAGDEVTVSAIVHNYLEGTKNARVSLDVTGLDVVNGSTQDVTVPIRGEVKVDWRLKTKPNATSSKLVAKALTNEESDALELTLPVVPLGVKQVINNAGAISEPSAQRTAAINFPATAPESSRGLDIDLAPSVAGSLLGSLEYLTSFPYGCTEQTMSGFLPDVIVAKTLKDLNIKSSIEPSRLREQVKAGMQRLNDFQHEDGGWGWWKDDDSMVFMTAYVVAGLSQAKDAGYYPDEERVDKGKQFLHAALKKHPNMISDLRAYVVYALALAGDKDKKDLDSVWDRKDKLSAEGIAFAGLTMQIENDARVSDAANSLKSMMKTEGDGAYWLSKRDDLLEIDTDTSAETTAYAVKFFTALSPSDPVLPQAIQWLMRHRDEGYYWDSTKQTAMVIYGVADYLKASKELEATFSADVLVNGKSILTKKFTPDDAASAVKPQTIHLNPEQLAANNQVEIRKNGGGRLYWSARGSYFSTDKKLYSSGTFSLNIARDYYKLTSHNDGQKITYDLSQLSGPVESGDVLAVRVTVSGGKWKYLLVEDPIPAGTEFIEHDELYQVNQKPTWWRNWYSRREFHDDRAAIFQTYFDGSREYFYLLKVVNPGIFQISPASVQPMYQPDVRSTTDLSHVEVK
ncbi:alpha-2-macroglobulin-like protein [Candidatus Koribacter versatilis Ellin345]|uniref:Alpha-2-macroglobulin-like protein n=1 Tax=Koribacter versatilis (strain Ellin345) TaxID=204669 RepID=Q1IT69_KORVE|nr:MG2 domain-containing protein [Candidatus Koribacter versatilis]ABF39931.1 alpha-2-macroglobulin-like protein [Candidatus Koribacter versatilis Ellin345]